MLNKIYTKMYILITNNLKTKMPNLNKTFDDAYFWKALWRELHKAIIRKKLSLAEVQKKIWMAQPHLSTLLNWRRTTRNLDQYRKIAEWIGMTENEFNQLVINARSKEYLYSIWQDPDMPNQFTLEAVLSRDFWIEDEDAIIDIIKYAKLVKNNNKK